MKTTSITTLLFCMCAFVVLKGQTTGIDWLQKSVTTVNNATSFRVDITTKVMAGSPTGDLIETTAGTLKRSGKKTMADMGHILTIQNDAKSLIVDKQNTNIVVSEKNMAAQSYDFTEVYTKLKPYIDTVYTVNQLAGYTDIVTKYKPTIGLPYGKIEVRVDNTTGLPALINMYMAVPMAMYDDELHGQNAVIQLSYANWILNEPISNTEFAFENYVVKKDGKWQAVQAYKNFEVTTLN